MLYIPRVNRYFGLFSRDFIHDRLRDRVLAAASDAGIGTIDLTDRFRGHADPIIHYGADMHFSERGAMVTADAIRERADAILTGRPGRMAEGSQ